MCFSPLPPLSNVEEQWVKLVSGNAMSLQHCIRGEGGNLNTPFEIPLIFCHWLSEIYKKKERGDSMHAVPNNSNLLSWSWLSNATLCHKQNDRKRHWNDASTAALLVLSYYDLSPVIKVLLQAQYDRFSSFFKLLCVYLCYFNLLDQSQPVLNNIFFSKIMCHWKDLH